MVVISLFCYGSPPWKQTRRTKPLPARKNICHSLIPKSFIVDTKCSQWIISQRSRESAREYLNLHGSHNIWNHQGYNILYLLGQMWIMQLHNGKFSLGFTETSTNIFHLLWLSQLLKETHLLMRCQPSQRCQY